MHKIGVNRIITISPSSSQHRKKDRSNQRVMHPEKYEKQKKEKLQGNVNANNIIKSLKCVKKINKKQQDDLNKSLTPMKPSQSSKHTRTSTSLKTASKFKGVCNDQMRDTQKASEGLCQSHNNAQSVSQYNEQIKQYTDYTNLAQSNIQNSLIQGYESKYDTRYQNLKYQKQLKNRDCGIAGKNIEDILKKIGQQHQQPLAYNNPSVCLQKKIQINKLRNLLDDGKQFISQNSLVNKNNENRPQNTIHNLQAFNNQMFDFDGIHSLKIKLRQQISQTFTKLHYTLDKSQQSLAQKLQQKFFQYKQKYLNRVYRISGLKNFIIKCESDINKNYKQVIQQLDIVKFRGVVQSYSQKLKYYLQKVRTNYDVRIKIPPNLATDIENQVNLITISICQKQTEGYNNILKNFENGKQNNFSQVYPHHQRLNSSRLNNPLSKSDLSINLKSMSYRDKLDDDKENDKFIFSSRVS